MKNLILICVSVALFFSCGMLKRFTSDEKSTTKEETKTETTKDEKENPEETKKQTASEKSNSKESPEMLVFDKSDLPSDIKYAGNIVTGKRWKDKNGENILILTKTKIKDKKVKQSDFDDSVRECELYGYHYVSTGGAYSLLWKINDLVNDCPLDLTLDFIPGSLTITDLNNNGIAESTFLYKMACKGDVSPSELKLMMHENDSKYALRGDMLIKIEGFTEGGNYKVDKSFDTAPDGFLDYAKSQWKEFKLEKFN
jgi:hypothetical protein